MLMNLDLVQIINIVVVAANWVFRLFKHLFELFKTLLSSLVRRFVLLVTWVGVAEVFDIFRKLFNSLSFIWKKGNSDKQIGQYQSEESDYSFSYMLMVIPMQSIWFHWSHRSHWIELSSFATSSPHTVQGYSWIIWRAMLIEAVKAQWGSVLRYIAIFDRSLVC